MSRKVDIAKCSFIRSFKIKHWQYLLFPSPNNKICLSPTGYFQLLTRVGWGGGGSLHRIHCPHYEGSAVKVHNSYHILLDLVGKGT